MKVTFSLKSDKGNREVNEDSIGYTQIDNRYCFALGDGLGGHGYGDDASKLVVSNTLKLFEENYTSDFLCRAFTDSQLKLKEKQQELDRIYSMKSTLVITEIDDKRISWGHIGDSRLYFWRGSSLKKRTIDHSVPQVLALSGEIKESEIRFHPDRNRLIRCMGNEWRGDDFELEKPQSFFFRKNVSVLMCSDGFWEYIDEKLMTECLIAASSADEWISKMEEVVLKNGASKDMDNYSAIAIWVR